MIDKQTTSLIDKQTTWPLVNCITLPTDLAARTGQSYAVVFTKLQCVQYISFDEAIFSSSWIEFKSNYSPHPYLMRLWSGGISFGCVIIASTLSGLFVTGKVASPFPSPPNLTCKFCSKRPCWRQMKQRLSPSPSEHTYAQLYAMALRFTGAFASRERSADVGRANRNSLWLHPAHLSAVPDCRPLFQSLPFISPRVW
jgi:hypothetical protein